MRIAIVSTGAHALPSKARTGDSQLILDLCAGLAQLGHKVTLFAPDGTSSPHYGVDVFTAPLCETSTEWEEKLAFKMRNRLLRYDIVHDWGVSKAVQRRCIEEHSPAIGTYLGGTGYKPLPNGVAQSWAMRDRMMRGASDYENTQWPENGGPPCEPFKEMRVVHNGIDTEFYRPEGEHEDWFLWLGRWHEVRGFRLAISWAIATGLPLKMVGTHPDDDHPAQAEVAREVQRLTADMPNVSVEFLPGDPDHHTTKLRYLQRAKALVNPFMFNEPFGLQQIEGPACGTPVISSRLGSGPEVVQEYQTGFTVTDMFEMDEAAERVNRIDRAHCRRVTVERFDRMVMAREYVKLYERVVGGEVWG